MPTIMTVCGPINPDELGFTSMHEHILYDGSIYRRRYEKILDIESPEKKRKFPFRNLSKVKRTADFPVTKNDLLCLENIGLHRRNYFLTYDAVSMHDEEVMEAEMADFKATGGML